MKSMQRRCIRDQSYWHVFRSASQMSIMVLMFLFLLVIVQVIVIRETVLHRMQDYRESNEFQLCPVRAPTHCSAIINKTVLDWKPIIKLVLGSACYEKQKPNGYCDKRTDHPSNRLLLSKMSLKAAEEVPEFEEEEYVDVHSLPLKPPQPAPPPERPTRRPWHPVMWDDSIIGAPAPENKDKTEETQREGGEYPHKQRIRNLRRLIEAGKIKPTQETLIFFLCNKFAVSEDRKSKVAL